MDSAKRQWLQEAEARKRVKSALGTAPPTGFTSLATLDLTDDGSVPDAPMVPLEKPMPRYAGAPVYAYRDKPDDDDNDLGDTQADTEIVEFVASQAIMEMTQTQPFSQDMVCMRLKLHPTVVANLSPESIEHLALLGLRELEFSLLTPPVMLGRELFQKALSSNKYDAKSIETNKLSGKHCKLECVADPTSHRTVVRLTDLSTNGTKHNGVRMVKAKPQTLHHDDKITLISSNSGSVLLGYAPCPSIPENKTSSSYIAEDPHVVGANATAVAAPASATHGHSSKRHIQENVLGVLFSSPLVGRDAHGRLHPIEELDLSREYDNLTKTLGDAAKHAITKPDDASVMLVPREIDLNVQFATSDNFQAMMTLGCRALHFSGHGSPKCLYFEDQESAVHPMVTDELRRCFFGGAQSPLRLVVVQACHSHNCASAFLACGVPHVIAVKVEERLEDQAAIVFTKNFYLALGQGKGVADSFDIARHAVAVYPHLAQATKAAAKFRLLPEGADHSEIVFPMVEMPLAEYESQAPSGERFPVVWCSKLPSLCQHFRHREADQYYVCAHFATTGRKFVWLVGPAGVGKSQLSYATARYLGARRFFPAGIKFVYVGKLVAEDLATHNNNTIMLGHRVIAAIKDRVAAWLARLFDHARTSSSEQHALLVLDGVDPLLEREETDVLNWIESLCTQYASLRLLVTARKHVVSPVFQTHGGRLQHLHPFSAAQAVDLLRRLLGKDRGLKLADLTRSPLASTVNHPDPNVNLSLVLERHPAVLQTGFLPREIAALASRLVASPDTPLDALVDSSM
ncbi:hypothetical protein ACHHYP_00761 [Achlya hypogyna]|uniref:FHA domain-containing protein n=1 Tax=Achlya hypogyna TaxID=1202772 RepID=A0A1V9ZTU4_ACHHY|nr:hypothetical protein ACHHYP_00761 [Achlya hypogyna]